MNTHTHMCILSHTHAHAHAHSLSLSLSLTHTHTHTHTNTLTHTHTQHTTLWTCETTARETCRRHGEQSTSRPFTLRTECIKMVRSIDNISVSKFSGHCTETIRRVLWYETRGWPSKNSKHFFKSALSKDARFISRPEARGSGVEAVFRFHGSGVDSRGKKGRKGSEGWELGSGVRLQCKTSPM